MMNRIEIIGDAALRFVRAAVDLWLVYVGTIAGLVRALAIDPVSFLVVPRVIAMMVALVALTVIGDLVALTGAAIVARVLLDIEWSTMFHSYADNLKPYDFLHGIYKSIAFGAAIAVSSCYFGVTVRGGAVGVGRAVNAAVVAAAVSIMLLDFFITYSTG